MAHFRLAQVGSLSVQNIVDGVVDEFEDETGVDTGASTNETYDSSSDYYHNPSGDTADQVPDMTSDTAPSGTVTATGEINSSEAKWRAFTDDGATSHWHVASMGFIAYDWGEGNGKTITKCRIMGPDTVSAPKDFTIDGFTGSDWENLDTVTNQTSWTAGVFRDFEFANTTSYEKYRINITATEGTHVVIDEIEFTESIIPDNVTLISNATTALAQPSNAFIVVWQEDVDAITLNTDLKAWASRDGTNYYQATLSEVASLSTGRVLTGTATFGAEAGTSMKWKIETLNTKEQRIHGVGLQWS